MSTLAPPEPPVAAAPASAAGPRIELAPCDPAAVETLREVLGCSRTFAQVLVRRGLGDPADARAFLAADEAHDPRAFGGIDDAVALILRHLSAGSRITVHGDYDVDGVCATALLLRALRRLGGEDAAVEWFLPSRVDDGYGLSAATVERLATRGTRLLVTVDCAITAVEEVALARRLGVDVVVTDHHRPRADGALPDAPIVHPALGGYPCPDLCAAGVAYKLAQALALASGADPAGADEDLDLVALATIADLVPLRGENRRLVRAGLRALAATGKPGLRALMRVARVDPSGLDARSVGFRLAPRINAAGRLHRADAGVELLLTREEARAEAIARELDAANAERRFTEQRILFEAEAQVRDLGERPAYVLAGEGWHPGVIGIVASRIVERHHRPAVLIALPDAAAALAAPGPPFGTGSGRSIPAFDLLGALHAAAPLLERYGGHRAAAGLTIEGGRVDELREAFEAHAASVLSPDDLVPVERVDAVVGGARLGLALADELARLEPTGMGNPGVNLLVTGASLTDARPMGEEGKHVRFTVEAGGGRCRAVAFGCDGRLPVGPDTPADATFRLERNAWNGAVEPRLRLRHAVACAPEPIEILGEPAAGAWLSTVVAQALLRAGPVGSGCAHPGLPPGARASSPPPARSASVADGVGAGRTVVDRRGDGALAVLRELVATGEPVLAVVADVPRRIAGLQERAGGFALCSHAALSRDPALSAPFRHVAVLDPPAHPDEAANVRRGVDGWTHLCWGDAELRFAQQIHDSEHDLRAALVPLYRALRDRGGAAGEELEAVLRGDGVHGRSVAQAARLLAILTELGLVSLDRDLPALAVLDAERTSLERSATWRAATQRHEDGRRWLTDTATEQPTATPLTARA
ncbi:MAG TPA: single-stranded-DNA-specific exonuclease RecJ [Conexibacter sp.]|nr:single-stranded-DNA-specific exonuclease RecJ [Conexibacter sp.]